MEQITVPNEISFINDKLDRIHKEIVDDSHAILIEEIIGGNDNGKEEFSSPLVEILFYLFHQKFHKVNEASLRSKLSQVHIKKLIEITAILSLKLSLYDKFYSLIKYYSLESVFLERIVIKVIEVKVKEKKFEEVKTLLGELKKFVDDSSLKRTGLILFQEIFTEKEGANKDYSAALKIRNLFNLEDIPISGIITREYNDLFTNKRFLTAAKIAKDFELNDVLIRKAGFNAFQVKLIDFREQIFTGKYKSAVQNTSTKDPYQTALKIVGEYKLLNNIDEEADFYRQQVVVELKEFLKKFVYNEYLLNSNFNIITVFLRKIVADYDLLKTTGIYFGKELDDMINYLVNRLDTMICTHETAVDHYEAVVNIKEIYGVFSDKIKNIAKRMLMFFIDKDMFPDARKCLTDFHFNSIEFIDELEEKSLDLLAQGKINNFAFLVEEFQIPKAFENDKDFIQAIYQEYKRFVSSNSLDNAEAIIKYFIFPRGMVLEPLKKLIIKYLEEKNYDKVQEIKFKFSIHLNEIREIMRNAYKKVCKSEQNGKEFRMKFNLSITYIGFFNWLFGEVISLSV